MISKLKELRITRWPSSLFTKITVYFK